MYFYDKTNVYNLLEISMKDKSVIHLVYDFIQKT